MKASHVFTSKSGNWQFEIVAIRARRVTDESGDFDAIGHVTITNGQPHLEGFLAQTDITRQDWRDIASFLISLGFERAEFRRLKNDGFIHKRKTK